MFAEDYEDNRDEGVINGKAFLLTIAKCILNQRFIAGNDITYADFVTYGIIKTLK